MQKKRVLNAVFFLFSGMKGILQDVLKYYRYDQLFFFTLFPLLDEKITGTILWSSFLFKFQLKVTQIVIPAK